MLSKYNYTIEEIKELQERVVVEAKKLLGSKFTHRGRTRFGVDCLGLIWLSYKRAGINFPDNDGKTYNADWYKFCDGERYLDKLLEFGHFVDNPLKADILTFKCFKPKVTHVGIYINDGNFIHCPSMPNPTHNKVQISNLDSPVWNRFFYKYIRFNGFKIEESDILCQQDK